jgi:hypothetical protein
MDESDPIRPSSGYDNNSFIITQELNVLEGTDIWMNQTPSSLTVATVITLL